MVLRQRLSRLLLNEGLFLLSLFVVAFGQPQFGWGLSLSAALGGYALAFYAARGRYWRLALWQFGVQLIQLSWLTATEYHGVYILFVYFFLAAAHGLAFGLLVFFPKPWHAASFWTLFEWGRQFLLCGYAWNPVGLSLAGHPIPAQLASIASVLGLSFLVIFMSVLALRSRPAYFATLAFTGLLSGALYFHHGKAQSDETIRALLVQTGLRPEEKVPFSDRLDRFVFPLEQWRRIIGEVEKADRADLVVLPESAVPFGAARRIYPRENVEALFRRYWSWAPLFEHDLISNKEIACALADHYQCAFVLGLEDERYNAALYLNGDDQQRYEKQVLVPLSEYLPFAFLENIVARYGIHDFFDHGKKSKVLGLSHPLSISICYEECFPHIMREGRKEGAHFFLNVTNDAYFPETSLPEQHFQHGRLRAIENGVPLLRSCNSGVSAAVDSLGRTLGRTEGEWGLKSLFVHLPLHSYETLYLRFGLSPLITLCLMGLGFFVLDRKIQAG